MILVCESDGGTVVAAPRLNVERDRVVLDVFASGERTDCQLFRLDEWPGQFDQMLADGFVERESPPDLKVVLDTNTRTLRIAGSVDNHLVDPATGTEDDPVDPLIYQADDVLAEAGTGHGYLRMSNWWNDGTGRLTAVMIPTWPSDIPPPVRGMVEVPIRNALAKVRDAFTLLTNPEDVAAWVFMCGDPLVKGFGDELARIQRQHAERYGEQVSAVAALNELRSALDEAHAGHVAGAVDAAERAARIMGGGPA